MRDTANQRAQLTAAINDLTDALDHTRPERVAAAALDPSNQLWRTLGPPSSTRGGLNAWCGIAERIEAARDGDGLANNWKRDDLETTLLLRNAPAILELAGQLDPTSARDPLADRARWRPILDAAVQPQLAQPTAATIDHGLGLEL